MIYVADLKYLDIVHTDCCSHFQYQKVLGSPSLWTLLQASHLSRVYDVILTMVDRFTKMTHFLPCLKTFTSQDTANLIMREVFKNHGIPKDIISDRGPQFISKFWKHLLESLRISCKLSSSYHPQTDGQTERTNQTLEQYLRCFINYQQDDWVDFLHMAEFAYNNSVHSSTGYTPFFANTGCHPRWTVLEHPETSNNPAVEDRLLNLHEIHTKIHEHLVHAQAMYKKARSMMLLFVWTSLNICIFIQYSTYLY